MTESFFLTQLHAFLFISGDCFSFWYSMYGAEIGELMVIKSSKSGDEIAWYLSGDQGKGWKEAQLTLSVGEDFYVCTAVL